MWVYIYTHGSKRDKFPADPTLSHGYNLIYFSITQQYGDRLTLYKFMKFPSITCHSSFCVSVTIAPLSLLLSLSGLILCVQYTSM